MFLTAVKAQLNSARVLAVVTFIVLLAAGTYWLVGTTGSPLVGVSFLALAGVLTFTIYWFVQVMRMFTGPR